MQMCAVAEETQTQHEPNALDHSTSYFSLQHLLAVVHREGSLGNTVLVSQMPLLVASHGCLEVSAPVVGAETHRGKDLR